MSRKETHMIFLSIGSSRRDVSRRHIRQGRRLLIDTIALANCCYSWAKTNIILEISLSRQSAALANRKESHMISHSIGSLRGDVSRRHIRQGRRF
ncbi:hypothetical protein CEXT_737521 [Caerostris extrusa]|uniref:Uncharacterized protein n=1 Tax=Caerostris extrusa TaxID=172846 RepID=A0AAV4RML4_CAEEX|nr:hypothetical protein CEXT_737521 [Caerostris extrusa]